MDIFQVISVFIKGVKDITSEFLTCEAGLEPDVTPTVNDFFTLANHLKWKLPTWITQALMKDIVHGVFMALKGAPKH